MSRKQRRRDALARRSNPAGDAPSAMRADPPWDMFYPATPIPMTDEQVDAHARALGVSREEVLQVQADEKANSMIFKNSIYQVAVRKVKPDNWPEMAWLSIKRIDREPVHDWRHLQRIKNEIIGPEHEGLELYPAEERVVDTANQYHLWVLMDPRVRIPFGFEQGVRLDAQEDGTGAKQRPF